MASVRCGRKKVTELQGQVKQASALTLVTNAVIMWNTPYMQIVIDQFKAAG